MSASLSRRTRRFRMKLFFGLVSCYWNWSSPGRDVSMAVEAPREEEPMSLLVSPVGGTQRGRTRDQVSGFRESEWKPSLYTISEEKLAVVVMDKEDDENLTVRSEVSGERRSGSRSSRSHKDDFGRSPSALVIPPFSPTPFLF